MRCIGIFGGGLRTCVGDWSSSVRSKTTSSAVTLSLARGGTDAGSAQARLGSQTALGEGHSSSRPAGGLHAPGASRCGAWPRWPIAWPRSGPWHGARLRGVRSPLGPHGPPRSRPGDRTPERRAGATWIDHGRLERACATRARLAATSLDPAFSFVYLVSKMPNSKKCLLS
jgi:hypothetical protein